MNAERPDRIMTFSDIYNQTVEGADSRVCFRNFNPRTYGPDSALDEGFKSKVLQSIGLIR